LEATSETAYPNPYPHYCRSLLAKTPKSLQGVGRSGDEIDESAREEGRSVRRVLNADSAREAVDPALVRVREIPSDDDDRLLVPRVVDIRLDGRCSFSSRSLFRANPFSAVFFRSEPRGSPSLSQTEINQHNARYWLDNTVNIPATSAP